MIELWGRQGNSQTMGETNKQEKTPKMKNKCADFLKHGTWFHFFFLLLMTYGQLNAQTGITYPNPEYFFDMKTTGTGSNGNQIKLVSEVSELNWIRLANSISEFNASYTRVNGFDGSENSALHIVGNNLESAPVMNTPVTGLDKGFTVSFWTRWPDAESETLTSEVLTVSDKWAAGISQDERVYVSRPIGVDVRSEFDNIPRPLWNLKFWNPEFVDLKSIIDDSPDSWIFIILVQEENEVRLHIGTSDGMFDCMYLDYGLKEQERLIIEDTQHLDLSFFSINNELYLDDLKFWDLPLCRNEAFEVFKDEHGVGANTPYFSSSAQDVVHADDNARMIASGRSEGCITPQLAGDDKLDGAEEHDRIFLKAEVKEEMMETEDQKPFMLTLYPNPASTEVTLDLGQPANADGVATVLLINLSGKTLVEDKLVIHKGQQHYLWQGVGGGRVTTNGIYVLKVLWQGKTYSKKLAVHCGC